MSDILKIDLNAMKTIKIISDRVLSKYLLNE